MLQGTWRCVAAVAIRLENFFKKMGQSRPLYVYFRPFLISISIIQTEKA